MHYKVSYINNHGCKFTIYSFDFSAIWEIAIALHNAGYHLLGMARIHI